MKKTFLILVIVAILAVVGFGVYQRWIAPQDQEADVSGQIVTVRRGDIAATVNATGVIQPKREMVLTFKGGGRVQTVYVEEGQSVTQGQVLAELEQDDLALQVKQAEIALRIAQDRLSLTQTPPKPADISAAEAALKAAQGSLVRLLDGATEGQLAAAEASLAAARERYDRLLAGPTEEELRRANLAIDQAKNSLWGAQNARDSTGYQVKLGGPRAPLDQAEAQVLNAEIAVTLAEMNYEDLVKGAGEAEVAAALASLEQARDAYETLQQSPRESDVITAESQVAQAEASLRRLQSGASEQEVSIARAQVDQARVSLEQAELLLDGAQLIAPFDGVVAAVEIKEGGLVGAATPAVALVDIADFTIEVNVDEIDIVDVQVGQDVILALDALVDSRIPGRVANIAPVASNVGGLVTYPVTIDVGSTNPKVRAGMTATAEITTLRREGVLLVPNRAIRIDRNDGTYHVDRWVNGNIVDTEVVPGLRNETHSEIVEGLTEGTELIIRNQSFTDRVSNRLFGG